MKKTALYDLHTELNAKIVDFSGWAMPIQYSSQLAEHNAVRTDTGLFDVSHMKAIDIIGEQAGQFLRFLLANDIEKLKFDGQALYSCMLNDNAGIIDDLIVYRLKSNHFRCVINAACYAKDLAWIQKKSNSYFVSVVEPKDMSILALQGPQSRTTACRLLPSEFSTNIQALKPFHAFTKNNMLIARTGYTGEDGLELILPNNIARDFWQQAIESGVTPCGLAARDTLRIEAGLNLFGQDMTEETSPLVSNLAWTISFEDTNRNFIGCKALEAQKQRGISEKLVGITMNERGVLRSGQVIHFENNQQGIITSGSFSPTLNRAIGFARVPTQAPCFGKIEIRKKMTSVELTKLPFVKHGKTYFQSQTEAKSSELNF